MTKDEIIASLDREVNTLTTQLLNRAEDLLMERDRLKGTVTRVKNAIEGKYP